MYRNIFRLFTVFVISLGGNENVHAQCCAGGSGSPIAGGASQGVLLERQMELSTSFQFIYTDKFYKKSSPDTTRSFDSFKSTYEYFKIAYGITKNFTMSVESGYYFNKKETGLNENPVTTYISKGFGDLILFPRYDIINRTEEKTRTELTIGLGYKIPLGSYNDSTGNIEPFSGQIFYVSKPTAIQLSSGAQDLIFYLFAYRGYPLKNFRVFANAMYIKKGWNANGEKLGDFASIGVFAGKTFFDHLGVTLQARYEWVDRMKINESILLFGRPSTYYPDATGFKKVFIVPQLSYNKGKITLFIATDFPVYQYINSSEFYTQAGSKNLTTVGLAYRFFVTGVSASKNSSLKSGEEYNCPMHPDVTSGKSGICPKCGMDLEIIKKKK
jgi:hypothetical protein